MLQEFFERVFNVFFRVFNSRVICLIASHSEAVTAHAYTPTKPEVQTGALYELEADNHCL